MVYGDRTLNPFIGRTDIFRKKIQHFLVCTFDKTLVYGNANKYRSSIFLADNFIALQLQNSSIDKARCKMIYYGVNPPESLQQSDNRRSYRLQVPFL